MRRDDGRPGLRDDDLERLAALGRVEACPRRGIVPLDGPVLVVVIGGYFRILRNAAFVRDVTLGLASRGDVLAPSAAYGERGGESAAEALVDGHVLFLSAAMWTAVAADDAGLSLRMAASIARRLGRVQRRVEEIGRAGVAARVASALAGLAADHGTATASGVRIDAPLSQEDLARLAGTTRETCSSIVAEFARRGFVRGGRLRGLVVLDAGGLERVAEGADEEREAER